MLETILIEVRAILRDKNEISINDLCFQIGILPDKINGELRKGLISVLKEEGWKYKSIREGGKVYSRWVNETKRIVESAGKFGHLKDILEAINVEAMNIEKTTIDNLCCRVGMPKITFQLRTAVCQMLKNLGWKFMSVKLIDGKITKQWVNIPLKTDPAYLRGEYEEKKETTCEKSADEII